MEYSNLDSLIYKAIDNKIFPGCVLGVCDAQEKIVRAFGKHTYEEKGSIVEESTVYDVASLTKTIVTATLMHLLIDSGHCGLKDPVYKYIPEFATNGKEGVLVEHLMSYTVNLTYSYSDDWKGNTSLQTFPSILQMLFDAPLRTIPGESYLYTDTSAILLGEIIRRVAGADLDLLAYRMIFSVLKMEDSTLTPEKLDKNRIVPTEHRTSGELVWGTPHDEKAYVAYTSGVHSGLAGLFTTVPDIMKWVQMILDDGTVRGKRFLSPSAVKLMTNDYYPEKDFRSALGWGDNPTFLALNGVGGQKLLAKGGFTGCFMMGDMKKKKALVFVSNRVYPKRPHDLEPWKEFRRKVVQNVFEM
jgi:serine-type D-Ala-D-Ala carboxypeptidase